MKVWRVERFSVEAINYETSKLDINIGNTFDTKEEAYKNAINSINQIVDANLYYREKLLREIEDQEDILLYYINKRNELIVEAKLENIGVDDIIL